jgi:hypothetical protein
MPPIDSHKVDDTDVAAIAAWIMQGCDGGSPPGDAGHD